MLLMFQHKSHYLIVFLAIIVPHIGDDDHLAVQGLDQSFVDIIDVNLVLGHHDKSNLLGLESLGKELHFLLVYRGTGINLSI